MCVLGAGGASHQLLLYGLEAAVGLFVGFRKVQEGQFVAEGLAGQEGQGSRLG